LASQNVTLPYPSDTEIVEILGHKVRQGYSSTIASDIGEKLPILITQYAQKHERELPNIRRLEGVQRRVLANILFYGIEYVDDRQLEQLVKECFV
jgi:hypothetical protein